MDVKLKTSMSTVQSISLEAKAKSSSIRLTLYSSGAIRYMFQRVPDDEELNIQLIKTQKEIDDARDASKRFLARFCTQLDEANFLKGFITYDLLTDDEKEAHKKLFHAASMIQNELEIIR